MTDETVIEFERRLSAFLAESGLSAFDALVAVGISLARVIYGLEKLHGADAAKAACSLLDDTMLRAWERMNDAKEETLQ